MAQSKNKAQSSIKNKIFDVLIVRSWWMWLFIGACYLLYDHGMQKKGKAISQLHGRLKDLTLEKQKQEEEQHELLLELNSQSDPAWIQMVLMKGLGVVPEGQVKVYFQKEE
ncbi:MAG: hypothetical protein ACM3JI_02705 [Anaerolineae bacterium]